MERQQQQQNYMTLFHQVLVNNITSKLGEYQGVRFTMGRTQQREFMMLAKRHIRVAYPVA